MVSVNGIPQAYTPQDLGRRVRELERQMQLLNSARNLRHASVDGPLTVTGSGSLNVEGDFIVPPGSISNESLESPIEDASGSAAVSNIAIAPTSTNTVIVPLTVPQGFTKALIVAQGAANVANAGASADKVTALCWVGTTSGQPLYSHVPAGGSTSLTSMAQTEATELEGGQIIVCTFELHTDVVTFPADADTTASINAFAIFRR